ncbi:MAG: OmpA family protein [bacterium]|nr:OmpA family protein [bacterium]
MKPFILLGTALVLVTTPACVSKKKYKLQSTELESVKKKFDDVSRDLNLCMSEKEKQEAKIKSLQNEVDVLKSNSNALVNQLTNLAVLTQTQAESVKKSIENLNSKDAYIKDLQVAMARKDSLNLALVLNLKGALKDINDQDIEVKVEGSAVFISLSDKLLFSSGSYDITPRAKEVLGKVALILNAQKELQFMVEGHTDNKPIKTSSIKDNWDLSVLRASSVVRTLQKEFGVEPQRMIACGRSEYMPMVSNNTDENRSLNRRTRIVIIPQLDQFFKLLEVKK